MTKALYCLDCGERLGIFGPRGMGMLEEKASHRVNYEHPAGGPRYVEADEGELIRLPTARVDGYAIGDRVRVADGVAGWEPGVRTIDGFTVLGHEGLAATSRDGHTLAIELLTPTT